jgi:hypothetical protein
MTVSGAGIYRCIRSELPQIEEGKEYTIRKVQDFWKPTEPHCLVYPKSGKGNYLGIMPVSFFTGDDEQMNIFDVV